MRFVKISCILGIVLIAGMMDAQPLSEVPYAYRLEAADTAFARKDYYNAVEMYEECYRETREPEIARKIAYSHDRMRDYKRAERWYQRIVQRDTGTGLPDFHFEYARLLKKNAKYDDAEIVLTNLQASGKAPAMNDRIQAELEGVELARTLKTPADILIKSIGNKVNTRNSDAAPAVDLDGNLYYVSFDSDEIIKVKNKDDEDNHAKIYRARRDNKGNYQKGKPIADKINRPGFHNSHVAFSQDGERMYFTRAIAEGGEITVSDLYYCDKEGRGWGAPQRISALNGEFISKHPTVGELFGSEVLIFSSDRPGTLGGLDLFYAPIKRDGTFGLPVNLGPAINTGGDEITPKYHERMLYFSSDGHPNIGGFDIYRAEWDGSALLPAEHMGKGVNTSVDDLYYTPGDDEAGFLVSNRDGTRSLKSKTCCDDIFTFEKKTIIIKLLASVFDKATDDSLTGATIKMYTKIGEELSLPDVQKNDEGNDFDFAVDPDKAYQVIVSRPGYFPDSADFNTVGVNVSKNFRGTFKLTPRPKDDGDKPESEVLTRFEPIRLSNIYYDLDDDQILPDAEQDLDFIYDLMLKYPEMVIELSSHTDARASDAYNLDLSQRRANSAKQYLEVRGIDDARIKAVGYGEKRILNKCVDGVKCTEAEHRQNRRTEFTIIEGPQTIEVQRKVQKKSPLKMQKTPDGSEDQGGSASLNSGMPKLEFEKTDLDLGSIRQGKKKKEVLYFKNTGTADLLIDIASACECTELDWPREAIKPGQRAQIDIEYDSTDKEGLQEVTVDVFANTDPLVTQAFFKVFVETIK